MNGSLCIFFVKKVLKLDLKLSGLLDWRQIGHSAIENVFDVVCENVTDLNPIGVDSIDFWPVGGTSGLSTIANLQISETISIMLSPHTLLSLNWVDEK